MMSSIKSLRKPSKPTSQGRIEWRPRRAALDPTRLATLSTARTTLDKSQRQHLDKRV